MMLGVHDYNKLITDDRIFFKLNCNKLFTFIIRSNNFQYSLIEKDFMQIDAFEC